MWKNYAHETTNMEFILWEAFERKITFNNDIQKFILTEYGYEYIKDLYNVNDKILGDVISHTLADTLYIRLEFLFENDVPVSDEAMKIIINNIEYINYVEDVIRVMKRFKKPFSEQLQMEFINKNPSCITLLPIDELKPNIITQALTRLLNTHNITEKTFDTIVKTLFKNNTLAVNKWLRYYKNIKSK
jgi:hypothetical protein